MSRKSIAKAWFYFGIIALFFSGFLSIIVTGAKMPFVKTLIGNLEFIRWILVIHVNLATLVWFTAVPVGLMHYVQMGESKEDKSSDIFFSYAGFFISVLGVVFMMSSLPGGDVVPLLSNYIPVVTHPLHDAGLILYFSGVFLNYITPIFIRPHQSGNSMGAPIRFGMWVGAFYFCLACLTLILAYSTIERNQFLALLSYYEIGMWGGGHLLQHSSSVFLVVCWVILLKGMGANKDIWSREKLFPVFAGLAISSLVVPIFLFESPTSGFYREGFTQLMRWGIAPFLFYFIIRTIIKVGFRNLVDIKSVVSMTFVGSVILIILGCVFGASIRASDLRIPGHYHATIGAVTVAFFVVAYRLLFEIETKILKTAVLLYVSGQVLFSSGMFTAGYFGIGRKTYGSEHTLSHMGQYVGFGMIGIGGLIALTGGICFGLAVWKQVKVKLEIRSFVPDSN